jgi:U3 small nucleolar RNA-associated protein 10
VPKTERKKTFLRVYEALLEYFKSLMSPYMSTVLPSMLELLDDLVKRKGGDEELWAVILATLNKSFVVDEGGMYDSRLPTERY